MDAMNIVMITVKSVSHVENLSHLAKFLHNACKNISKISNTKIFLGLAELHYLKTSEKDMNRRVVCITYCALSSLFSLSDLLRFVHLLTLLFLFFVVI